MVGKAVIPMPLTWQFLLNKSVLTRSSCSLFSDRERHWLFETVLPTCGCRLLREAARSTGGDDTRQKARAPESIP